MTKSTKKSYDLIVIGSGSGGIHAAVQGAKCGKKVGIVEKNINKLGGAWIQTGTIPSKTLRESLASIQSIRAHVGDKWVDRIVHDLAADTIFGRAQKVSAAEESHVRKYLEKNKIDLIGGFATLENETHVRVVSSENQSEIIQAEKIIISTGSSPRRPADIPFDGWRVVDSDGILLLKSVPKKLVIYGAGVIGCEYACIFNALGVDTSIVDARDVVMQTMDREISEELKSIMEESGVKFIMNHELVKVEPSGSNVVTHFSNDLKIESDVLFFAAGRVSNTDRLNLERLNIEMAHRGAIAVNKHFQTNIPNIYAVGDAIGAPALAATSAQQGRHAACHALNDETKEFPETFPVGVYTIPELSAVGKTEEELNSEKIDYVVGRAFFKEVARGYIGGETSGLLKMLICMKTSKILGIHVVGPDACNLIHVGLGFMLYDAKVDDIVDKMIFNYPTLSETYRIAAFNAINKIGKEAKGNSKMPQKKPRAA